MSRNDERGRPAGNGPANVSLDNDATDDTALAEDSVLLRVAESLPSAAYVLGYRHGVRDELRRVGQAGQEVLAGGLPSLRIPRLAELAARREDDPASCRRRHVYGCSRCARAEAVATNLRRYGSPDFPGGVAGRRCAS